MRWSNYFIPTLKEAPADAEVASHKLLIRAGMIRRLAAGIYNYLPLGWRTITKVEKIVREEMNRVGAMECRLPSVQPGDLWEESGRWKEYGTELLRFKDRHKRDYCLGPTHEEVITSLMRNEIQSYRQMPLFMYQIQTKFRDEIRPRFGLMRGREFIMKDAYSFDQTDEDANLSYRTMYQAYATIFTRLGLKFRSVEADAGSIGGSMSHEFMVLAETGEDTIISCSDCDYAANEERARGTEPSRTNWPEPDSIKEVFTPDQNTVEEVANFMDLTPLDIVKTILMDADGKPVAALVRGDRELNEIKLKNYLNASELNFASPSQVEEWTGAPVGFAGPVKLKVDMPIVADLELYAREGWVTGANKEDTHLENVSLERDVKLEAYVDLRVLVPGDECPVCNSPVTSAKGIEVGHVFKLGDKYSKAMGANFVDAEGNENPLVMGCYGIGITRVVAACIEQNHDKSGIIFPPSIAPFTVLIISLDPEDEEVGGKAEEIYELLSEKGIEVLMDDRNERPGVKFNDADLIGIPMQIIVGRNAYKKGHMETKDRRTGEKGELPLELEEFKKAFTAWQSEVEDGWRSHSLSQ